MNIPRPPSEKTLRKYGLSEKEWRAIFDAQGGACAVCRKPPKRFLHIDHDHVRGWKSLPPEKRKLHIRGLLCFFCNQHYVGRAINIPKSRNVTAYLEAHEDRLIEYGLGVL